MRLVIVESPYAGKTINDIYRDTRYARACLRDCLMRGEAPFASHLLYTQDGVLRDEVPKERELGIKAGAAWIEMADALVVYTDLGVTDGMVEGMIKASKVDTTIEKRRLGADWDSR